ncbi:hypothetical protein JTE90_007567, partial [Oedothorax gibbosus]
IHLEVGERYRAYWCVRNWHQPWVWRAYEVYMLLLLLVVPSLVMGFAYCSICHQLWIVVKDRANMSCGEIRGEPTGASYWCKSLLVRAQLAPSLGMACLRSVHAALAAGGALTGYGVRLLLHLPPAVDCGQGSGQHELRRDTWRAYWCVLLVGAQLAPAVGVACLRSVHAALTAAGALAGNGFRLLPYLPPAVDCGQGSGQHELRRD